MGSRLKKRELWTPLRLIDTVYENDVAYYGLIEGLRRASDAPAPVWKNAIYTVIVHELVSDSVPGGRVTWLSIRRNDREAAVDWRHFQKIKNELCGPRREAVELFPAEDRLVDTSNQYHLWVFPEGVYFPVGWMGRAVGVNPGEGARQRPFNDVPDDCVDYQKTFQKGDGDA